MRYTTIVDKSEETLNMIIGKAEEFDQERVLNGLDMRHYTQEEVRMLTSLVTEYHAKLQREIVALVKFAQDFNKQYATDNNKCFDTASRLFNRIRGSIAGTKKVYRRFCLKLCRDVMQQEREIRGDLPRVLSIYETCCSQVVSESRGLMQALEKCGQVEADEMTSKKSCAQSVQQFVSDRFHTLDKSQFQIHAMMDVICKGRRQGLTELESMLWNNNLEFVQQVRTAIARFDELQPAGQMNRVTHVCKLSARYVAMLMQWCGITGTGKEKQFVEEYFNHAYQGQYQRLSSSSVNAAKNKYSTEEYTDFCLQLTDIISPEHQQKPLLRVVE